MRRLKLAGESAEHEADALQNADVGQRVSVQKWESDGSAFVDYRGAQWRVVTEPGEPGKVGIYEIVRVDGSRLVVRAVIPSRLCRVLGKAEKNSPLPKLRKKEKCRTF